MANGYLGKISAIVSANTADFDGKLSKSAKEVSSFARSVQSNLTSASRQAARSLEGIYTPLQKFERSLQAAATMKLSFKGFPGMIKDLDSLQSRLNSALSKRQVDIVLKTTGMSSVSALRDAISGLKSKDIELIARFGGLDKLKELKDKITVDADVRNAQAEIVRLTGLAEAAQAKVASIGSEPVAVKVNAEGIDALKTELDGARAAAGKLMGGEFMGNKSLATAISSISGELVNVQAELGRAKAARDTLATMASGSKSKPEELNAANSRVSSLAGQEQQLSKRLADLEKYRDTIKKVMRDIKQAESGGGGAATDGGDDIVRANKEKAAAVRAVTKATKDLQKQLAAKFGVDIDLASLNALIKKADDAGGVIKNLDALIENLGKSDFDAAADSMRKLQSASSQIFEPLAASVKKLAGIGVEFQTPFHDALKATQADVQRLKVAIDAVGDDGPSPELLAFFLEVQAKSDGATKAIDRMVEVTERLGQLKTGKEFVFEQPRLNEAINKGGDIGNRAAALPAEALRTNPAIAQSLVDIRRLSDEAGVAYNKFLAIKDQKQPTGEAQKELDAVVKKLLEAQGVAEKEIKVVLDVAEAERKATELKAKITALKQDVTFTVTGKVQNFDQAEAEIKRIIGGMDKLDAAQRQALKPKVNAAISSLGMKDAKTGLPDIAAISAAVKDLSDAAENELVIKVNKDKAQKSVDELKASLASIADKIGEPSEPIDRLRKAVDAANAAIAKMPAGALKTKLEADLTSEKLRLEAMARAGTPPPKPPEIDAAAERTNSIAAAATAATPAKATANPLGADFGTAERSIASLQSNVSSLQSSLEKLPVPMQAQFIPAINKVRDAFQKLTPASTAAEIDAVVTKAKALEGAFTRAGQAAKFGGTLGDALNEAAITRTEKRLGFVKAKLLEVGASASGPVANAFNRYSAAAASAAQAGTSGTAATTKMLDGLIAKIGQALVAEGKLTAAQGRAFSKNVGDVGRGGADKFSLALNQAAFAVDDFMSSTGGLEFKLRAISNNITQLAFVLRGTTGLFVGLGAVIAGQAAVGLIKWANNGRSAEDQTKALNEALSRQKGLMEGLAQAFKSLGDSVSQGTFSTGGETGRQLGRGVSDIRSKQREIRDNRVAESNTDFQRNAANLAKNKRLLESETDPAKRVSLISGIRESEQALRALPSVLANRPPQLPPAVGERSGTGILETPAQVQDALFKEVLRVIPTTERTPTGRGVVTQEERERRARAIASTAGDTMDSQREAIKTIIGQLRPQVGSYTPGGRAAGETVKRLNELLEQLESPFQRAIDDLSVQVATASEDAARSIRDAQEDVAQAIGRGVPGAAEFQRQLDSLASELSDADAKLARAVEMSTEIEDPAKREAVVKEAEKQVADVRIKQAETEAKAREVRLGRSVGGERLTSAISAMDGNERFKNERAGAIASSRATAAAEMQARRVNDRQSAAVSDRRQQLQDARAEMRKVQDAGGDTTAAAATVKKAEADLKAAEAASRAAGNSLELAQAASEAAAALLETAAGIEAALTRIRKVGDSALQRSEQGADAAQKAFEENPLQAGSREARDAAERRLINDRATIGNAQADLDNRRREIQQNPQVQAITGEMEAIKQRRQVLEAKEKVGGLNPAENAELDAATKRYIELVRQLEMATASLTDADRKQRDIINSGIIAREKELDALRRKAESDPSFDRRREAAGQIAEGSRRQADEAQQRYVNNPTEENRKKRDEADQRYREDRKTAEGLQESLDAKRKAMQKDPRVIIRDKQLQANNERLAALAEKEAKGGLTRDELEERKRIQGRNRDLRGERDAIIDNGTRDEKKAIDDAQIAQNQRDRALRGRDLGLTDRERFRKEFTEGAGADINARAKEMRANGEDPSKFLRQALANQMESVAPMLQSFKEERQNAILQGPSRAALNVSDVSTSQGASELTRLLRGDDSAKDVNLAELKKQSGYLEEIRDDFKRNNPGVLL